MRIEDLDEFQGLTPQMVREWLGRHGWVQTKPQWWEKGEDGFEFSPLPWQVSPWKFDSYTWDQLWFWLYALAAVHNTNIQGMLREINPRMRKGMPSQEALRAHRGLWLRSLGKENIAIVLSRLLEEFPLFCDTESFFWPCDEHYSKVRWPTDAQGNML